MQSFNPLFPGNSYSGAVGLFGPTNLTDVTPAIMTSPRRGLLVGVEAPSYWRTSTQDGVYSTSLAVLVPPAAGRGKYVGTNPGILVVWDATRHLQLQGAITRFIPGAFLDDTAMLVIVAPLYIPLVGQLDFSLIWFGILYTLTCQVAYITPPFGYNLFLMRALAPPEITLGDIYRSIVPFFVPLPMMFLGLVTGGLQAFIFVLLSVIYLQGAVAVEHAHDEHGHDAPHGHQAPAAA